MQHSHLSHQSFNSKVSFVFTSVSRDVRLYGQLVCANIDIDRVQHSEVLEYGRAN